MEDLTFNEIEDAIKRSPALPDLPDERDFVFAAENEADLPPLPASFSLRDKQTKVKNQGSRGTCTGFAVTAIAEFLTGHPDLSEEYIFAKAKAIDIADYNYSGYGAYLRSAAKALNKHGICRETLAPYKDGPEDSWKGFVFTPEMEADAATRKADVYVHVGKHGFERALVRTNATLLIGVMLHESYRAAKKNGGFVPVPKAGEKEIGGHAMTLVGYNEKYYLLKNSWGETWGDEGYLWWPRENIGNIFGAGWSFVKAEDSPVDIIQMNKKLLLPHQVEAWNKAIAKGGLINAGTRPDHPMTKGDFMVFLDRLKLI